MYARVIYFTSLNTGRALRFAGYAIAPAETNSKKESYDKRRS